MSGCSNHIKYKLQNYTTPEQKVWCWQHINWFCENYIDYIDWALLSDWKLRGNIIIIIINAQLYMKNILILSRYAF